MTSDYRLFALCAIASIAAVAGCAGAGNTGIVPSAQLARFDASAGPLLFVSDVDSNVLVYTADINVKNPPLKRLITSGISRSYGLFVDTNKTLYVSNQTWPPSIVEYKPGQSTPFRTITNGLRSPSFMAVDSGGTLYVADDLGNQVVVLVYLPNSNVPSRTITIPDPGYAVGPEGLAFDAKGNLLVGTLLPETQTPHVFSIAPGSSKAIDLQLAGLPGAEIGTDAAGDIYAGSIGGNINVFKPGAKNGFRLMQAPDSNFDGGLTVTPNGTVFWPAYDGTMFEFAAGKATPTNSFRLHEGGIDAAVSP